MQEEKEILLPEKFAEVEKACDSYTSFIDYVSHMELGNNIAFYIGQGNVRGRVMGFDDSLPTKEQLEEMKAWVRQAMECGYLGMTTGLVYAPSVYAGEEELVELAKVVGEYGGSYASHIRGEADNVVESVEEAIRVGEKAGIPVVISHLKVIGKQNEGLSEKVLQVIEDANARGVKVRADQYPYLAGSAPFISCIPPKFHVGGVEKLVEFYLQILQKKQHKELKNYLQKQGGTVSTLNKNWISKVSGKIATGDIISIDDMAFETVVYGDISGDGAVTIKDLLLIQKYLLGSGSINQ